MGLGEEGKSQVGASATNLSNPPTGGGLASISDSMNALTSVTKGISGIIEGIFTTITKLFTAIMDASPLLQGVLKIVDKMFRLVLMPIGNMIGRLLLPIAVKMAKETAAFLSKVGNLSPDKIGDVLTEGLGIAFNGMIDMLGIVLQKVLWPVITALGQAIINGIVYALTPKELRGEAPSMEYDNTKFNSLMNDAYSGFLVMGEASSGAGDVINQFGLTVQTGNRLMGNSFSETVTAFYKGSADISNGFQSVHEVLVVGTPKAIEKFSEEFHLAGAGLITVIDTLQTPFKNLKEWIDITFPTLPAPPPNQGGGGETQTQKRIPYEDFTGGAYARIYQAGVWSRENQFNWNTYTPSAKIETQPTLAEQAALQLGNTGQTVEGSTITLNITGNIYGVDDLKQTVREVLNEANYRTR